MFGSTTNNTKSEDKQTEKKAKNIYNPIMYGKVEENNEIDHASKIDQLLENEKQQNKTESWNKLDKTVKIQKLHAFAEKYGKDNAFALKDIKTLKLFFKECLDKNKLQKTKDVQYNKDSMEIISVPALFFNSLNRNFTLKNMDAKRISTLKSLTPKRQTESTYSDEET
jgi:hypothetical protein